MCVYDDWWLSGKPELALLSVTCLPWMAMWLDSGTRANGEKGTRKEKARDISRHLGN